MPFSVDVLAHSLLDHDPGAYALERADGAAHLLRQERVRLHRQLQIVRTATTASADASPFGPRTLIATVRAPPAITDAEQTTTVQRQVKPNLMKRPGMILSFGLSWFLEHCATALD